MRLIALFCFLFCFTCLQGQNDTMIFYPVNNPLLQQCDIHRINIAGDGKLWLSTNQGILSYNGNDVQDFGRLGVLESFVNLKDHLFLLKMNGIYSFDTRTANEEYLDIKPNTAGNYHDPRTYTDIMEDTEKSVWCGRTNGFLHYDMLTKKTTFYSVSNSDNIAVRNIQGDVRNSDILWLATDDGIYRFDKRTRDLQRNFICSDPGDSIASDIQVSKIHVNGTDTIWFIGGKRGVGSYSIKSGQYTIYPYRKEIVNNDTESSLVFLQAKNSEEYYIGSQNSCPGIFNTKTYRYSFSSRTYKELPALNINHFMADDAGNLWCVIFGQLYYASTKKNKFVTIPLRDRDSKSQVRNIFKTVIWDAKRRCYYAAFDNSDVIFVLDSNMKRIKSIPIQAAENETGQSQESHLYEIALDNYDRLWACGTSLSIFDSLTQSMVPVNKLYKNLLFRDQRFQNIISRNNYVYLQPSNPVYRAMYRVDLSSYTYDSIRIPYEIIPVGYENSWNGRNRQEVAIIDKQGKYAYTGMENYILQVDLLTKKGKKITRVSVRDNGYFFNMFWYVLDDDGNLWVTSSEGIRVIDPNSLKTIKKISHGYQTNRYQIYNAEGKGIMCLLYSEGVMLYDYRSNKEYQLSLSDGLITLFNSGISCVNNRLFVGAQLDALQFIPLNSIIHSDKERRCYLSGIQLFNLPYSTDTLPEYLHALVLPYDKNFVTLTFSSTEFDEAEQLEYRYKLTGVDKDWINTSYLNRTISYPGLKPGNYVFYTSVKNKDGSWNDNEVNLQINIIPAFWQTSWFKFLCVLAAGVLVLYLVGRRIQFIRKSEQQRVMQEKKLLELEARALRAQMNPHFIFNSLNSIKSLINKSDNEKASDYLTTFSKLIRTLFQNSDRREISLFEELETCKLYTQIEKMRFGEKVDFIFDIDSNLDLKDIKIPALVLQPFIENAIWHGLVPKESGGIVVVSVKEGNGAIECVIDDNGIGRELSKQFKAQYEATHQSKGIGLTRSRLELDKLLNDREDTIHIIDKKDKEGKPGGTTVIITFKENNV